MLPLRIAFNGLFLLSILLLLLSAGIPSVTAAALPIRTVTLFLRVKLPTATYNGKALHINVTMMDIFISSRAVRRAYCDRLI